jgi:hypothetical protein
MAEDLKLTCIEIELDLGFGYAQMAQAAYFVGRTDKGDAALQTAWDAWERAASLILKHEIEALRPRVLELEALLRGIGG